MRTTTSSKGRSAGKPMGLFRLAGLGGGAAAVAFPRAFERFRSQIQEGRVILARATVDRARDEPSLLVEEVFDLADPSLLGNRRLRRNHGVVASFSRALVEGLSVTQSDAQYNAQLDGAIQSIFEASNT